MFCHLTESLERFGPSWTHWQFPMERVCGQLLRTLKSKSAAFANISIRHNRLMQRYALELLGDAENAPAPFVRFNGRLNRAGITPFLSLPNRPCLEDNLDDAMWTCLRDIPNPNALCKRVSVTSIVLQESVRALLPAFHAERRRTLIREQVNAEENDDEDFKCCTLLEYSQLHLGSCDLRVHSTSSLRDRAGTRVNYNVARRVLTDANARQLRLEPAFFEDIEYVRIESLWRHEIRGCEMMIALVGRYQVVKKKSHKIQGDSLVKSEITSNSFLIDAADIDRPVCIWPITSTRSCVLDYEAIRGSTTWQQ